MGKKIIHDIVVLENLQDNIIGIDCTNKHFLGNHTVKQSPIWENPPIDSGLIKTMERVYLDALSSKVVKIRYQVENGNPWEATQQ